MGHLDEDALLRHAAGSLAGDAAAQAEVHVAACPECQERLAQISSLILSRTHANLGGSQAATQRVTQGGEATPADSADTAPLRGPAAARGTAFGRYVLEERLGSGGMGEVYVAQDPRLDRKIALKILRPGSLGTEEGQARLLREAQSMARLSHPNVVTVHDVGEAEDKVYVAMELVEGESLAEWLRAARPWQEVLELLLAAGAGLAAAHRAGVIHRDFKPDNVLVGQDGRPRVLDFGLARHTSQKREARQLSELPDVPLEGGQTDQLTRDGAILGTPGYMAPEQLSGLPTDARSDQFSFCVTTWEALYGKRPFGGHTLKAHAAEITAGKLPDPPSGSEVPRWVRRALQRGLAADPSRRWPSMDGLLKALALSRRRATSRGLAVATGVAVLAALVAFAISEQNRQRLKVCGGNKDRLAGVWDDGVKKELSASLSAGPGGATRWKATEGALDAYVAGWVKAADETCVRGQLQKLDSDAIYAEKTICLEGRLRQLQAQVRLLAGGDAVVLSNALRAARSLDPVGQCTDALFLAGRRREHAATHSPEEEALAAKLRDARALFDSGQYARCAEQAVAALKGPGPAWLLADGWLLAGRAQLRGGQGAAAEQSFFDAAVHAEQAGTADAAARAWARLAGAAAGSGREAAEGRRHARLARANLVRAGSSPDVEAELENSEGQLDLAEGDFQGARGHFARALSLQEAALGEHHPETAMTLNNLGVAQSRLGLYDEALKTYASALEVHLETSGAEHPNTASTMQNLAVILTRKQRLSEALSYAERALAIREAALGPESPDVANSLQSLSKLYRKLGAPEKGLAALQRALAVREKEGPESLAVATVHDDLAHFYLERRDHREALTHAQRAMDLMDKVLGPENPRSAGTRELLGVVLSRLGQWERSKKELDLALKVRRAKLGEVHPEVASSVNALGDLALAQGQFEAARALYQQALDLRQKALGPDRPELAVDYAGVGRALLGLKRSLDAAQALERAVELRTSGDDAADLARARFELAQALWEAGGDGRARALELCGQARPALDSDGKELLDKWLAARAEQ